MADYDLMAKALSRGLPQSQMEEVASLLGEAYRQGLADGRHGRLVLDRETCDWVIDDERDTTICRTHGETADGVASPHFPGGGKQHG